MSSRKLLEHLDWQIILSLSIPVSVLVASIILPYQPLTQQAFIGIMLVWFGVECMLGISWWR
jgi:hypothetical protein